GGCAAVTRGVPIPPSDGAGHARGFLPDVPTIRFGASDFLVGHVTFQTNAASTVGKNCLRAVWHGTGMPGAYTGAPPSVGKSGAAARTVLRPEFGLRAGSGPALATGPEGLNSEVDHDPAGAFPLESRELSVPEVEDGLMRVCEDRLAEAPGEAIARRL